MKLLDELRPSVASIAEFLAMMAKGYNNHLKWNEQAMFKADLMNARQRWFRVDPAAFAAKLREEGMRDEDATELVGWLKKAQTGRRLIPQRSYRDFKFSPPPEGTRAETDPDQPRLVAAGPDISFDREQHRFAMRSVRGRLG